MTDQALLAAYLRAVWTIQLPRDTITLSIASLPAAASEREACFPPDAATILPAGIVTAYNPRSVLRDEVANRAANQRLRSRLEDSGARLFPTTARDPLTESRRWDEAGFFASGISRELLIELAGEFDQNALVWIDERGAASLVAVRPGFCGAAPGDTLTDP